MHRLKVFRLTNHLPRIAPRFFKQNRKCFADLRFLKLGLVPRQKRLKSGQPVRLFRLEVGPCSFHLHRRCLT